MPDKTFLYPQATIEITETAEGLIIFIRTRDGYTKQTFNMLDEDRIFVYKYPDNQPTLTSLQGIAPNLLLPGIGSRKWRDVWRKSKC